MVERIKVTILLEHHQGDVGWTSRVPLIENCFSEGPTPEEAVENVKSEIAYFVKRHPELKEVLGEQPEFGLREAEIDLDKP